MPEPSLLQATLARELSEAKIAARQDAVDISRYGDAMRIMTLGMRVVFHQGGAESLYARQVPGVGRITAAGYLGGIIRLTPSSAQPNPTLLAITRRIFPGWQLAGHLTFKDVRRIKDTPLTKDIIDNRKILPGDNYIVLCPGEQGYDLLLETWQRGNQPSRLKIKTFIKKKAKRSSYLKKPH